MSIMYHSGSINIDEEIANLTQELEYTKGFLNSVMKNLVMNVLLTMLQNK